MRIPKSAFLEGNIKKIYDWFIGPLIYYKPDDVVLKDWMNQLFHLDHRSIIHYRAKRAFKLPGLYWLAAQYHVQGLGYRLVKRSNTLLVRHDSRDTTYDVQFYGGPGNAEQIFTLSIDEWNQIRPHLEAIDDEN